MIELKWSHLSISSLTVFLSLALVGGSLNIDQGGFCRISGLCIGGYGGMNGAKQTKKLEEVAVAHSKEEEEARIEDLKIVFGYMDTNKSGTLTYDEVKEWMNGLGLDFSVDGAKKLIKENDANGDGVIDENEYIAASMRRYRADPAEELLKEFKHYDKDNSGFITLDELDSVMNEYGMGFDDLLKGVFAEGDTNKDGIINYEEFRKMMST